MESYCDGTYRMLFNKDEGSSVDCTIEDAKLQKEEERQKERKGESWP